MGDRPIVEELVQVNIFPYDIDFVDWAMIGELARRSVGNHSNIVRLLRYNSHICYVFDINVLFEAYRCSSCGILSNSAPNLELQLTTSSERVKHVYAKNVNQLREKLFDKLGSFDNPYTDNQDLPHNLAIFDFKSICVEVEIFKDTETTTYIREPIPILVSISSNSIQEPIFLCDPNPRDLFSSSIDALEFLARQSKAQMKMIFLQIETAKEVDLHVS